MHYHLYIIASERHEIQKKTVNRNRVGAQQSPTSTNPGPACGAESLLAMLISYGIQTCLVMVPDTRWRHLPAVVGRLGVDLLDERGSKHQLHLATSLAERPSRYSSRDIEIFW